MPKYQEVADKAFNKTDSTVEVEKAIFKQQVKKIFAVIKAPDSNLYLVDRHHNILGIYELYLKNENWLYIDPLSVKILMTVEKIIVIALQCNISRIKLSVKIISGHTSLIKKQISILTMVMLHC